MAADPLPGKIKWVAQQLQADVSSTEFGYIFKWEDQDSLVRMVRVAPNIIANYTKEEMLDIIHSEIAAVEADHARNN